MIRKEENLGLEMSLLGLLALLWGASYLFIKVALADIPPVTLMASRVSMAALFLWVVMRMHGQHLPRDAHTWCRLLIQAFFNSIGAWTVLAWGQQYIDSGLASVLNSTSPLFVFLITLSLTRHEPVTTLKLSGACLGLCGVILIVGWEALAGLGQQLADQLAALLGALLYAGAAIYGKRFGHLPATVTATGTMICASAVLLPLSVILDSPWALQSRPESLMAALALATLSTGIALLIYFRLVQTLGSLGVASQAYLRAGVGVLLGVVILGETITWRLGLGLTAAVFGVMLINFPVRFLTPPP